MAYFDEIFKFLAQRHFSSPRPGLRLNSEIIWNYRNLKKKLIILLSVKMIFKGSCPSLKFQHAYALKIRLQVGIFDGQQNDKKKLKIQKISNNLGIRSDSSQFEYFRIPNGWWKLCWNRCLQAFQMFSWMYQHRTVSKCYVTSQKILKKSAKNSKFWRYCIASLPKLFNLFLLSYQLGLILIKLESRDHFMFNILTWKRWNDLQMQMSNWIDFI